MTRGSIIFTDAATVTVMVAAVALVEVVKSSLCMVGGYASIISTTDKTLTVRAAQDTLT